MIPIVQHAPLKVQEVDGSPSGFPRVLKFSNGTLTDNADGSFTVTISGGGGTLDQAYDFGGAGAGKTITVDSGPVTINATDGGNNIALRIDQQDTDAAVEALYITSSSPSQQALRVEGSSSTVGVATFANGVLTNNYLVYIFNANASSGTGTVGLRVEHSGSGILIDLHCPEDKQLFRFTDTTAAKSITVSIGNGTAESVITANPGSLFIDATNGVWYRKNTGTGNTGWVSMFDHGTLIGLTDDDHTQYALLAGRSGGQTITGGTAASNNLTLRSTSNATKGDVKLADEGGNVIIGGGATASRLRLMEPSGSGTNYTEFVAQAQTGNITYTIPAADGTSGQFLSTNGSGTLLWASSKVVQIQKATSTTAATTTSRIPNDNTIPQNTEGAEYLTLAITPTSSTNRLLIEFNGYGIGAANVSLALFQDTTANALAAISASGGSVQGAMALRHEMAAGTTSATTFKIRFGRSGTSGTATMLGDTSGVNLYGGVDMAVLTITEYVP